MSDQSRDQDSKLSKVISGKKSSEYQRWEVPSVKRLKQQTLEKAGLTAGQLEAIQKQAYDEGFQLGKKEGHEAGLKQGQDDGLQQGLKKGQEEIALSVKHFEQIMKFLSQPIEQVDQNVEQELINLSMATAKQIIRREITIDPGQIIAVIKEALSALPSNSKKIKVYLHPSDAQIAREHLSPSSNQPESEDERWSVIDEPNITRGGCQIKSEFSQIDASIDTRIAEIAARLLGSERTGSERTDSESSGNEAVTETETETKSESNGLLESSSVEVQKDD